MEHITRIFASSKPWTVIAWRFSKCEFAHPRMHSTTCVSAREKAMCAPMCARGGEARIAKRNVVSSITVASAYTRDPRCGSVRWTGRGRPRRHLHSRLARSLRALHRPRLNRRSRSRLQSRQLARHALLWRTGLGPALSTGSGRARTKGKRPARAERTGLSKVELGI